MKKYIAMLMLVASTLSMVAVDADAKRLGGGGSFGRQSQGFSRPAPSSAPMQQQAAPRPATPPAAAPATRPASPWRGMLGGALLGLGLGAMLSHFGIGGAFASVISTLLMVALLGVALMFIIRLFRRKDAGANGATPAYAGGYARSSTPEIGSGVRSYPDSMPSAAGAGAAAGAYTAATGAAAQGVPADFDVPGFLRHAKTYFIRLQDAWDKADVKDISEFTTPEMFAELRMQIQERGASPNVTDVVQLNAELLGIETGPNDYLASVKFSGLIKEAPDASATEFAEIWNLSKPTSGQGGWVLAGLQQLS
ncbi:Tim44 domain-containing protein [Noviherbaspirillum suwonense]|uniref:Predicted lipid-binding transport protein, Tim44 family n=1 Tax=Noviherbaspirillum suwonense TaxID=1224511 RepID=A0ABY1QAP6_9BURK|nr:Tim44-like domain-containing protein [Noviherbaspirillum suwonense]SMP65757.1 Predicted lipid-binding transport protein, Tim44 family [Noviherbaspirillum suwonense]